MHPPGWRTTMSATLHCLAGCGIGDMLGMVLGTACGSTNLQTIALAVIFGYALTLMPLLTADLVFRTAAGLALAADTISTTIMEIVNNAIMWFIPGAMDAPLDSALLWGSLGVTSAIAAVAAMPVKYWLSSRGKGHAVVHAHTGP